MIFTIDEYRVITYLGRNNLNHAYTMLTSEAAAEIQERDVGFITSPLKSSVLYAMTAKKKKKKANKILGRILGTRQMYYFGHIKSGK